ncbi:MAG: winged helix-turn-helix transcriptional regulator, partial [Methanomicrobium sp.]|nr:winged helix-turn-helix transcriptional regulator [Methanomicrobium sp.]
MGDSNDNTIAISNDPDFYEDLSEYLNVLSNPTRLKILKLIEHQPKEVREIAKEIDTSYENTKKHLDKLLNTGVI